MSLLQLKREAVPPTSPTQRQARFQAVAHESYPFGQTGLGACSRPAPGSHVTQFRKNRHRWGGLSKGLEAASSNGRIRGGVEECVSLVRKDLRSPNATGPCRSTIRPRLRPDRDDLHSVSPCPAKRLDSGLYYDWVARKSGIRSKVPFRTFLEASPSQSSRTVAYTRRKSTVIFKSPSIRSVKLGYEPISPD